MALLRDVQHHRALLFQSAGDKGRTESTGDIGIHARAGDVLADLPDHQHVRLRKQEPRHTALGVLQQRRFAVKYLLGGDHLQPAGEILLVFDDGHAEGDAAAVKHLSGILGHPHGHGAEAGAVQGIRTLALAHANGHHLHQTGLIGAAEGGVRLDAPHHNDRVGSVGKAVHTHLVAVVQRAHLHRLHAGIDGAAAERLGDPVALQQLLLLLGNAAGMAAHGRNDIRLCALFLYEGGQLPQHHRHIVDLTAAAGQHHLHARLDAGPDVLRHQPLPQIRGDILNGVIGKMLLDDRHLRQRHRRQHLPQFGLPFDLHIVSSFGEVFSGGDAQARTAARA